MSQTRFYAAQDAESEHHSDTEPVSKHVTDDVTKLFLYGAGRTK